MMKNSASNWTISKVSDNKATYVCPDQIVSSHASAILMQKPGYFIHFMQWLKQWFSTFFMQRPILQSNLTLWPPSENFQSDICTVMQLCLHN